jgi:hypothetical protein
MFPSASESLPSRTEEAVRLLGQLSRKRREHGRQNQRFDPGAVGDVQGLLDEDVRAADDRPERDEELDDDGRHSRPHVHEVSRAVVRWDRARLAGGAARRPRQGGGRPRTTRS